MAGPEREFQVAGVGPTTNFFDQGSPIDQSFNLNFDQGGKNCRPRFSGGFHLYSGKIQEFDYSINLPQSNNSISSRSRVEESELGGSKMAMD